MKKIVLIGASERELKPFISMQVLKRFSLEIVCTGIGPYQAALSVEKIPPAEHAQWICVGLAASCNAAEPIGTIIQPNLFGLLQWIPPLGLFTSTYEKIQVRQQEPPATLWTSPIPVHERNSIQESQVGYIDMEAYVLAKEARRRAIPFSCFKILSDHCTKVSSLQIQKSIDELSHALSQHVRSYLERSFDP